MSISSFVLQPADVNSPAGAPTVLSFMAELVFQAVSFTQLREVMEDCTSSSLTLLMREALPESSPTSLRTTLWRPRPC